MDNDIRPQRDGSDSFLYPGEEHHYASGALKTQSSYPGEEHYYGSGKLKTLRLNERSDVWKISTVVLAVMVALLLVNTMRMTSQHTQVRPAQSKAGITNFIARAPRPVLIAGSIWQGTFYQHDYVGNYYTPMILRIDSTHGSRFSGTTTESNFDNAVTTNQGNIVDNIDNLGYLDKERFEEVINEYGSAGTLVMYTDPYQLNGDNVFLNSHVYALVTQDGVLHGIDFDPNHDPNNLRPDGDFTLYKVG